MTHDDNEERHGQQEDRSAELNSAEAARRKLMTKLVAGAFAVPTVLATLSRTAAATSG